jgi:hypothetical protein
MGLLGGVVQPAMAVRRLRHASGTTLRGILPFLPLSGYVKFYNILRQMFCNPGTRHQKIKADLFLNSFTITTLGKKLFLVITSGSVGYEGFQIKF